MSADKLAGAATVTMLQCCSLIDGYCLDVIGCLAWPDTPCSPCTVQGSWCTLQRASVAAGTPAASVSFSNVHVLH